MRSSLTLGIDVSSKTLDCALFNPIKDDFGWRAHFDNTAQGIDQLISKAPADAVLIVEPTGRYGHALIRQAQQNDRQVLLAPNRRAKDFLRSLNPRAKTDRIDGAGLARFGAWQELKPYVLKSDAVEHLDQLLTIRRQYSKELSQLTVMSRELNLAGNETSLLITTLKNEIARIDRLVAKTITSNPEFKAAANLRTVPGIGPVTAAAVASRLCSKAFVSADAFVAYVGLDLTVSDSGNKIGVRHVSKRGDAELRRLLYCCAQSTLRCKDQTFKEQYDRERAKGLASTQALVAIARKLAKLCWSIARHSTTYDPSRVFKQPSAEKTLDQARMTVVARTTGHDPSCATGRSQN